MQIRGQVLSVRPWDFKSQSNERIQMLSVELYDDTAGLVRAEMRDTGFQPTRKADIVATVSGIKKARFGDGVIMTIKDVQPIAGNEAVSAPPPFPRPPESTQPTAVKK